MNFNEGNRIYKPVITFYLWLKENFNGVCNKSTIIEVNTGNL